ncbi:unnamed protein product, partial [marine sediment metagenome]
LSGNIIFNCSSRSIALYYSSNNTLTFNTVYNGTDVGIYLYRSENNNISYNIIYNNTDYGLSIAHDGGFSDNNIVTWNNFVGNNLGYPSRTSQAYTEYHLTMNNISSNYWSDWSGSGNYPIDGTANNEDPFPLGDPVLPTVTILTPIVQEYDIDTITVMLSGTPTVLHYQYYIAGFDEVNQTWTASVDRTLSDGSYTLYAYGSDLIGNTVHDSVTFTIDAYLPTVAITSPTNTTYTHTGVPLIYTVSYGAATIYLNGMENTT